MRAAPQRQADPTGGAKARRQWRKAAFMYSGACSAGGKEVGTVAERAPQGTLDITLLPD